MNLAWLGVLMAVLSMTGFDQALLRWNTWIFNDSSHYYIEVFHCLNKKQLYSNNQTSIVYLDAVHKGLNKSIQYLVFRMEGTRLVTPSFWTFRNLVQLLVPCLITYPTLKSEYKHQASKNHLPDALYEPSKLLAG